MSRRIAGIVNEPEKAVAKILAGLEEHNGYPSHDARYIADTHQQLRNKLLELNLDPEDTTAQELFHALQARFESDSRRLDWYFKAARKDFDEKLLLAIRLADSAMELPEQWVLKTTAAKNLLRELPPKHVMKVLRYRSVESLLKREKPSKIFVLAEFLESERWNKHMDRLASKLDQTCFEVRRLEILSVGQVSERPLTKSELTGAIGIAGDTRLLPMLLRIANALKEYGADTAKLYGLNWIIGWWADTDNLIANLEGGRVSLNVHDVAAGRLAGHGFDQRQSSYGQASYWRGLLDKYENKAHLQEVFDGSAISRVKRLNFKGPQPAFEFEYAEDL